MTDNKKTYEAMFLLDSGNPDFHAASEPARTALERNEAEVVAIKPWDDRRLAYEVRGRKRGLYVLTYFKVLPEKIAEIERDCRLDERILRVMLLRHDRLTDEMIHAETPATSGARRAGAHRSDEEAATPAAGAPSPAEEPQAAAQAKPQGQPEEQAPAEEPNAPAETKDQDAKNDA